MKRKLLAALCLALAAMLCAAALGEAWRVADGNAQNFGALLADLLTAHRQPTDEDAETLAADVAAIAAVSEADGALAEAIRAHWSAVYLDPDYALRLYHGDGLATELEASGLADGDGHAFVVLGYELKDGEMTDELKGRCDAAAAAARAYPKAILVCSGGATGDNNPDNHTEAGLMRDYLAEVGGIDPARIFTDERAMTTLENAVNTLAILEAQGIRTMTIVTSAYHHRWGEALYNAMAEIYRQKKGYEVRIAGDFSFDIAPSRDAYRNDDYIAIRQMGSMLSLPDAVMEAVESQARTMIDLR